LTAAEAIAERLQGRPVSRGRWVARCPAHPDRAPSLRVAEGREGRALLHCFAGCSVADILRGAGLSVQQLFPAGPAALPQPAAAALRAQAHEQARRAATRLADGRRIAILQQQWREWDHAAGALAYKLATLPDHTPGGAALTACYHNALAESRRIERALTGDDEWA
jgi:hypothetical protein